MAVDIFLLATTAAFIGIVHTLIGPDHYVPFIVISRSAKWSFSKTMGVTVLSGVGHVLGSVLLGFVGIALGIAVSHLEGVESTRGQIAAWGLIAFGLVYFVWGMRRAYKKKHGHHNDHEDHDHHGSGKKNLTPWILFTIFVFGPCEPLIPLVMYPAATNNMLGVVFVTLVFGVCTITTMTIIVLTTYLGLTKFEIKGASRFGHAIAGASILVCGLGMAFLGL
jgi:nickel/cobalt transporter (NicO) family protein